MRHIYLLLFISLISGCASLPTVDSLQHQNNLESRLYTITHNILASNLHACPNHKKNYGFKALSFNQDARTETEQIWVEAFYLKKEPTVVIVTPNRVADKAGMLVGDVILSFNNRQWPATEKDRADFMKEFHAALISAEIRLVVQRNDTKIILLLIGEDVCDAYIRLVHNKGTLAYAHKRHAVIESGLVELLNDAELAFIVAHELAHIFYGHTAPEREEDLKDSRIRSLMEKEADAMAIQLMIHAGYDPEAATTAIVKFDYANRGPITRWLGFYGVYMPTEQRIEFLRASVHKDNK